MNVIKTINNILVVPWFKIFEYFMGDTKFLIKIGLFMSVIKEYIYL